MDNDQLHNCLLFSRSTFTNDLQPSTNAVKVAGRGDGRGGIQGDFNAACPYKYEMVRHQRSEGGIRVGEAIDIVLFFSNLSINLILCWTFDLRRLLVLFCNKLYSISMSGNIILWYFLSHPNGIFFSVPPGTTRSCLRCETTWDIFYDFIAQNDWFSLKWITLERHRLQR